MGKEEKNKGTVKKRGSEPEADRGSSVRVFRPKSLSGLLRLYEKNPEALLYAGGTEIAATHRRQRQLLLPAQVLYLGNVQDLKRVSRSQRHLVVGAGVTLSRILKLGRHVLPRVLYDALSGVGTPAVQNLATLGGNICARYSSNDSLCALSVIAAQVELRTASSVRWVGIDTLVLNLSGGRSLGELLKQKGEVLTRIRVPLEEWNVHVYRKVGKRQSILTFAGVARYGKGGLEDVHFAFGGLSFLCSRNLSTGITSGALPLPVREIESLVEEMEKSFVVPEHPSRSYFRASVVRLLKWFFASL